MTLGDSIERCLKKGKGDEQSAAAMCSVLLLMQLGAGEDGEEVMRSLYPVLKVIVLDNSASYAARAAVSYSGYYGCNCLTVVLIVLYVYLHHKMCILRWPNKV